MPERGFLEDNTKVYNMFLYSIDNELRYKKKTFTKMRKLY